MANLQIKGIDDRLYEELKTLAAMENRSVSQQVLYLIRSMISRKNSNAKSSCQCAQTLKYVTPIYSVSRQSLDNASSKVTG
jgi:hypothetical protein